MLQPAAESESSLSLSVVDTSMPSETEDRCSFTTTQYLVLAASLVLEGALNVFNAFAVKDDGLESDATTSPVGSPESSSHMVT